MYLKGDRAVKNLSLLVWMTQLGISVALPPCGFILLSLWLRDRWNWGGWVLWIGIIVGMICAFEGLRSSLKAMEQMSKKEEKDTKPVSFNEHD